MRNHVVALILTNRSAEPRGSGLIDVGTSQPRLAYKHRVCKASVLVKTLCCGTLWEACASFYGNPSGRQTDNLKALCVDGPSKTAKGAGGLFASLPW